MSRKILSLLSGIVFLGAAGAATAAEPVKLSDAQLGNVTAGAAWATAGARAFAFGARNAATATNTNTVAVSVSGFNLASSRSASASFAN